MLFVDLVTELHKRGFRQLSQEEIGRLLNSENKHG
jgi:hypothetical protein